MAFILNLRKLIGITSLLFSLNCISQIDQPYFDKLKTDRVISEDDIKWTQFAPGNAGFSNLLRYHPTKPNVVVLVPDLWVVYQSEDNGKTWYSIKDKDGRGDFERLNDLYYSTNDENFGLAIERSELWETNDMGKNWTLVKNCPWYNKDTDGSDKDRWRPKLSALGLDATSDDIWYIGAGTHTRGKIASSTMKNANAENPRGENGYLQGKIWKTTDRGQNWQEISNGLDSKAQFTRIIVNPKNNQQVFAASNYGLYRSNNGGTNWTNIGDGKLQSNMIMDMDAYFDPIKNEFVLYLIDQVRYAPSGNTTINSGGIYKTSDGGDTFTNITGDLYLDINQLTGGVPYNYYQFIARWFDIPVGDAQKNYPIKPRNVLQYFNALQVDPSQPDALYVGFADPQTKFSIIPGRLWKTVNGGTHWKNTARDYGTAWEKDKNYWMSRNNPYHDNMEMGHEPFFQQWGENYPLRSLRSSAVNSNGDVMIIAAHNTLVSTDKGASFQQVDEDYTENGLIGRGNSNLPGESLFQDKRRGKDNIFLGSGEHRLWLPTHDAPEGRQAIKQIKTSMETIGSITTHPLNENEVYITSFRQHNKEKIKRSIDGGLTFEDWGIATPAEEFMRTHSLTIDPKNPSYFYFGITDKLGLDVNKTGGFYVSDDGGKTFAPRNNGLPTSARVKDLKFDPRDTSNASLFAAAEYRSFGVNPTVAGGLYHTSNRGLNWEKINIDPEVVGVNEIQIDNTGRIYISSGHRSNNNEGGIWFSDDYGKNWEKIFDVLRTESISISPFDNHLLLATTGLLEKNPGIFLSEDRGKTWRKNNLDGLNTHIRAIEFDIHDPTKIWAASMGNGFNFGIYENGKNADAIGLKEYNFEIATTQSIELTPEIKNEALKDAKIVWSSSNPSIAIVNENGKVSGISKGQVIITALINNRYSDQATVVVSENCNPIDPNDTDNDGVPNDEDICPNTPFCSIVDAKGCVGLELPSDNFRVLSTGTTCTSKLNGSIHITSQNKDLNFTATIAESNLEKEFKDNVTFDNLGSGEYTICLTTKESESFEQCFTILVKKPEDLSVIANVNDIDSKVTLQLDGGPYYKINLNGKTITTEENTIDLNLSRGVNNLTIKTEKDCQGTYTKTIVLKDGINVVPNPAHDFIYVNIYEQQSENIYVTLTTTTGQIIIPEIKKDSAQKLKINLSELTPGMYFLKVKSNNSEYQSKFIKH